MLSTLLAGLWWATNQSHLSSGTATLALRRETRLRNEKVFVKIPPRWGRLYRRGSSQQQLGCSWSTRWRRLTKEALLVSFGNFDREHIDCNLGTLPTLGSPTMPTLRLVPMRPMRTVFSTWSDAWGLETSKYQFFGHLLRILLFGRHDQPL